MRGRAGLDQDTVVRAAVAILNDEGPAGLTIHRLAKSLGVRPPSLYNHISGLPGLYQQLEVLNARQLGDRMTTAAVGKSGAAAVMAVAQAYREYIKENAGLYLACLRASRNQSLPDLDLMQAEDRVVKVVLSILEAFHLSGDDALHAVRGLRSVVHGFATIEAAGGFGLSLDCDESFRRLIELYIHGLEHGA